MRYDKIVEYLQKVAAKSDRIRVNNLGPDNKRKSARIARDRLSGIPRNIWTTIKLWSERFIFKVDHRRTAKSAKIFREGKAVIFITNNIHSTEIGSSQMAIELAYRLATEDSPMVRKILDNVIFLLVPSRQS